MVAHLLFTRSANIKINIMNVAKQKDQQTHEIATLACLACDNDLVLTS